MKPVRLHAATEDEIATAFDWYQERSPRAATGFLDDIARALNRLREWPQASPVIAHGTSGLEIRRMRLSKFPYGLVYVERENELVILAVPHLKRRPLYWIQRIGQLD